MDQPFKTIYELEADYRRFCSVSNVYTLDLSAWLPSLKTLRPVVPGEFVLIVGDTATGKTACLQNIAHVMNPYPVYLFELELPGTQVFERFVALANQIPARQVEQEYQVAHAAGAKLSELEHIYTCSEPGLTTEQIEAFILQEQKKADDDERQRPLVVMVDYTGLLMGVGRTDYERMTYIAKALKRLAKRTNTIVVASSQKRRSGEDNTGEIYLHDAKGSGQLENSAQLVLGIKLCPEDVNTLEVRVLKCTRGAPGKRVTCNFDGPTMRITERYMGPDDPAQF